MPVSRAALSRNAESRASSLLVSLGLADSGHDNSQAWIVNAVQSVASLWSLIFCVRLMTMGTLLYGAHISAHDMPYLIGSGIAVLIGDAALGLLPRLAKFRRTAPHIQMWIMLPLVALSGGLFRFWLTGVPGLAADVMLFAGGALTILATFLFGSRRILGLAYFAGAGSVGAIGDGRAPVILTLLGLLIALALVTLRQARIDQKQRLEKQAEELRGRRAERLLHEYERSGRGWFWETDRSGRISYISETLVATLDIDPLSLLGRPLTELISHGDRQQGDGERTLGFHLSARTAFSDIAVRAAMTREERWWAISGRPIVNDFGQFHGFRGSGADLTEMRRSQAEVTRLAQYDSLTGLANRVQMLRTLEQAVVTQRGEIGDCALLLLDLDRFKSVNDTLGHPAGDQLLRSVSHRLQRVIGDRGRVGRLGGDEFKVVLPGRIDRVQLAHLADVIIASVSQPYSIDGSQVVIGASIGIAICPDDGINADAMIRNADLALYAAKGDGRGNHKFYSADMHADAEDRRQLEEDLRNALASKGLHLVYQPVVSSATEQITGYEALLRWEHPTRGAISPSVFIPIAEDTGLISQIGQWVLRTACCDAATWPTGVRVAVNVSPIQFANPSLPGIVMSALANAQLSAERLELEITESVFLNDGAATDAMFAKLKGLGVRLALDDFGTGYSSLGYLKTAPFDKIKIDQSFVRGAAIAGSRNSAIIKSIVSLAEALSMDTTAEGAETHDELDLIRSLGCSHVQGFIYGRPMPASDVALRHATSGVSVKAEGFRSSRPTRKAMLRSVAVIHDGQRYAGRVRNISSTGALIEGLWSVPAGTLFHIELADNYAIEATARWSVEDRMGVEFVHDVDLAKLRLLSAPRAMAG